MYISAVCTCNVGDALCVQKSIREILGSAEVILSTINGASPDGSLKYASAQSCLYNTTKSYFAY